MPDLERVVRIFNGRYTLENTKTGEHRTFQIRTQPKDAKFSPGLRVISLLRGPDNERDYYSFGFVSDQGIQVWYKQQGRDGVKSPYDWYALMLWEIATEGAESRWFKDGYRLMVSGTCVRCNRLLTEPESVKAGVGPVCAGRA